MALNRCRDDELASPLSIVSGALRPMKPEQVRRLEMKTSIFPGWYQALVSFLMQTTGTGTILMCFSVIVGPLEKTFGTTREQVMLIMTVLYLMTGATGPVLGAIMDRYSIRKIMLIGGFLLVIGNLAVSYATSVLQVMVIYGTVLTLALGGTGNLAFSVLLSRWFTRHRGRAMAIAVMGISTGGVIFPPILQFLIDSYGWRDALRIFSGILFILTVPPIAMFVVDRPSDLGLHPDGDPEPARGAAEAAHVPTVTTATVLRDPNFWFVTLVLAAIFSGSAGFISNMVPLAVSKGLTVKQGAFGVSCIAIGSFSSMALYALIGDKVSSRAGLGVCLLIFALSGLSYLYANAFPLLALGAILQGLAVGFVQPIWSVVAAQAFGPANVGRVFGLIFFFITPFTFGAHPFLGRIYDKTGTYDYGCMFYIGIFLAAMLLVTRIRVDSTVQVSRSFAH
jgi:MFS family permease